MEPRVVASGGDILSSLTKSERQAAANEAKDVLWRFQLRRENAHILDRLADLAAQLEKDRSANEEWRASERKRQQEGNSFEALEMRTAELMAEKNEIWARLEDLQRRLGSSDRQPRTGSPSKPMTLVGLGGAPRLHASDPELSPTNLPTGYPFLTTRRLEAYTLGKSSSPQPPNPPSRPRDVSISPTQGVRVAQSQSSIDETDLDAPPRTQAIHARHHESPKSKDISIYSPAPAAQHTRNRSENVVVRLSRTAETVPAPLTQSQVNRPKRKMPPGLGAKPAKLPKRRMFTEEDDARGWI